MLAPVIQRAASEAKKLASTTCSALLEARYLIARDLIRDYCAAGGRSLWSIRDCNPLRNESSVSIVLVNPA